MRVRVRVQPEQGPAGGIRDNHLGEQIPFSSFPAFARFVVVIFEQIVLAGCPLSGANLSVCRVAICPAGVPAETADGVLWNVGSGGHHSAVPLVLVPCSLVSSGMGPLLLHSVSLQKLVATFGDDRVVVGFSFKEKDKSLFVPKLSAQRPPVASPDLLFPKLSNFHLSLVALFVLPSISSSKVVSAETTWPRSASAQASRCPRSCIVPDWNFLLAHAERALQDCRLQIGGCVKPLSQASRQREQAAR